MLPKCDTYDLQVQTPWLDGGWEHVDQKEGLGNALRAYWKLYAEARAMRHEARLLGRGSETGGSIILFDSRDMGGDQRRVDAVRLLHTTDSPKVIAEFERDDGQRRQYEAADGSDAALALEKLFEDDRDHARYVYIRHNRIESVLDFSLNR